VEKTLYRYFYIVLQTSFLTTPIVENKSWTSCETLESIGEMKLMMKFCVFAQFHWSLKFIFWSSHEILFSVLFQETYYILYFNRISSLIFLIFLFCVMIQYIRFSSYSSNNQDRNTCQQLELLKPQSAIA